MIATALAESRGFDGYKRVKGHKRHIVVETMGIPLPVQVTEANASDSQTALGITVGSFLLLGHYPKATGRRRLWGQSRLVVVLLVSSGIRDSGQFENRELSSFT